MGIGIRLTELMEIKQTNASELAKKIGISKQTIYSLIKRDSTKADIELLSKLAHGLGVSLDAFVDSDDEPTTIAAHFDGDEFTEEELDEIRQFAAFVKLRNRNRQFEDYLSYRQNVSRILSGSVFYCGPFFIKTA